MREVALVAVTVLASACHHEQEGERASTPSPAPQRRSRLPPPQRISLVRTPIEREAWLSSLGRGSSGRAAATHFLHVDITADPALGMNVRFLNVEGEPEFRCTPRGALYLDHHRSCFLAGTCPAMVKQVTGFEWDLADLVEIMNGGAPHVAAPGEKLVGQVTEVGCNVMSTKAPLHSWRVKHQFKFAAAPPEPCPAPYEISYSVVELPYSDENNSVSFDWGDRRPLQMDPARVELSPPAGYVTCPPRSP